jgi:hypothetical protein
MHNDREIVAPKYLETILGAALWDNSQVASVNCITAEMHVGGAKEVAGATRGLDTHRDTLCAETLV